MKIIGALAFCLGSILGLLLWVIKFSIPMAMIYLIFAFVFQESNYRLWSIEARAVFVILSGVCIYGIFLQEKDLTN
jgi:formate-dependent nitrite reductase membrane component NrfD